MRFPTMALTAAAGLLLTTAPAAPAAPYAAAVLPTVTSATLAPMALTVASVAPLQEPNVTVQVNEKRTSWYTQPIWLAIGGVALVVIILIAVLAGRAGRGGGSNTTVVK
jgi:hypothetical protein